MSRKIVLLAIFAILIVVAVASCNSTIEKSNNSDEDILGLMHLVKSNFEDTVYEYPTGLYIIKNAEGMSAALTNYGGRIVSLLVPDRYGKLVDVIAGFGGLKEYKEPSGQYFGAIIGRYANRIAKGQFTLDGQTYHLPLNAGLNTLHGGGEGFQRKVFDVDQPNDSVIAFTLLSKDGDQGFPGNLSVKVIYSLMSDYSLNIEYEAETDRSTVINLTNHAFFNLNGEGSGTILKHKAWINARQYLPIDSASIPLGIYEDVKGTPFDFSIPEIIGERIEEDDQQLRFGKGYDHNFILNQSDTGLTHAAFVVGDVSAVRMDVYTDQPGVQFYTGNFLSGKNILKGGSMNEYRTALALETQHFPNSLNEPDYPSTTLNRGEKYYSKTIYRFSTIK